MLQGQTVEPGDLVGREQMRLRLLGQMHEVGQVPHPRHIQLICGRQPFVRVGPHRLQQPVARRIVPLVHDQERFIHQLRQQFQGRWSSVTTLDGADGRGAVERTPSGEHRQPAQERLLRRVQQAVAPVDSSP